MQYTITEFEQLYRSCSPAAFRVAFAMLHDDEEARDAVQEVFIKLWERGCKADNTAAYVVSAVRNVCINRLASIDIRERLVRALPLDEAQPPDSSEIDADQLNRAISMILTPREREVIDLKFTENMSYQEAATKLGVSTAMINKSIVNALRKLRNHFNHSK
ncbi:MAG: sigma-70 family RNA polymerase sigma factor [Muribaculaceae bacterium]|nr:sigma-70 family RNA polymerase sigma factor [Muribaculaceae bacterium]